MPAEGEYPRAQQRPPLPGTCLGAPRANGLRTGGGGGVLPMALGGGGLLYAWPSGGGGAVHGALGAEGAKRHCEVPPMGRRANQAIHLAPR